jgi:type 1 glutamine amidotransferase
MPRPSQVRLGFLAVAAALAVIAVIAAPRARAAADPKPKQVLFFTKSSDFEHSVIKRRKGEPSYAEQVLAAEGPKHGIAFTFSKDGSLFTPEYLAQFDAFMFYTSGDLLAPGKDGNPPMTPAGKAALLDAIRRGKGFVGIHSATDTFHTGETAETNTDQPRAWRYRRLGDKADPYTQMIGGELMIHGTQQIATVRVTDPKFPGFADCGDSFEHMEEWYSLADFAPDMHVLLVLDTGRMRDPNANGADWPPAGWDAPYQRPPYLSTWARLQGKGRVFYTSLGHRADTWMSPRFHGILFGGLDWALGRVEADVTPNLQQVAPGAYELPPVSGKVSGLPKALKAIEDKRVYPK